MLKNLLGFDLSPFPIYWLMLLAAFIAGWIVYGKMFRQCNFSRFVRRRVRRCFFWSGVCALAASNAVNWLLYEELLHATLRERIVQGGYSSFFGLLVFFGTAALFLRMGRMKVRLCLNQITPAILLALFLARLGCTLTGCCYGKPITLFGATFLFPTTELEAVYVLTLFIVLLRKAPGKRFWIFSFSYSALRFVLEFFRGDDRGSLLGITALTPVQLFVPVVFLLSAYMLFKDPFCRYFLLEHKVLARRQKRLERLESRGKTPYAPYPYDYTPAKRSRNPLHVLGVIALCLVVFVGGMIYLNPFGARWCQNLQYSIDEALGGSAYEQQAGTMNGVQLQDVSGLGTAESEHSALQIATAGDSWTGATLQCTYKKSLPNGSYLYGFAQTVQGVPVYGTARALVTDSSYHARYVAGDETGLSYTAHILPSYAPARQSIEELFGPEVTVLESMDCWYDTGEGLVAARQVLLSTDGAKPVIGAILDRSTDRVITLTGTRLGVYSSLERSRIQRAAQAAEELILENSAEELQQLLKTDETVTPAQQETARMRRALLTAYLQSGMTAQEFLTALASANAVADYTPNLNARQYANLLTAEVCATLQQNGLSDRKITACQKKLTKAFDGCGIPQAEDEAVTDLTVKNKKSTFSHTIAGRSDKDLFRLTAPEGKAVQITFSTQLPVEVQVCRRNGGALTTLYVEQQESFFLYPEDGTAFTLLVSSAQSALEADAEGKYDLTVEPAEEETVPFSVTSTLALIESAYKNSNAPAFYALCISDLQSREDLEMMTAAVLLPVMAESCSGCQGQEAYTDAAKTLIARALIDDGAESDALDYLEDSALTLTYVGHAEEETGIAVKAQISITLEGVAIYEGYTFFRLTPVDYQAQMAEQTEEVKNTLGRLFSASHCISEFHTDGLYAAFGDTRDSISHTSELQSLYALQSKTLEDWGNVSITLRTLDEQAALSMGHSRQKVNDFYNFTNRQNIMTLKRAQASLQTSLELAQASLAVAESAEEIAELVELTYDLCTDPAGKLLEAAADTNEVTKTVYNLYSWLTDAPGQIKDLAKDTIKQAVFDSLVDPYVAACRLRCEMLGLQIQTVETKIADYEKKYRR